MVFPEIGTTSPGDVAFASEGNNTRVTWTTHGDRGSNPLLRCTALFADSMAGKDFEAGLAHLKAVAEKP